MTYIAIVNVPGYSPMSDEPATFDSAQEAWAYLADERERDEDDTLTDDETPYSETHARLAYLAHPLHWEHEHAASWVVNNGLDSDGTGVVYSDTPGYTGDHDLGLAYSVQIAE